jgi:hypothetical protein
MDDGLVPAGNELTAPPSHAMRQCHYAWEEIAARSSGRLDRLQAAVRMPALLIDEPGVDRWPSW